MTLLGVYAGNSTANLVSFEQWLGTNVDTVLAHVGMVSWSDFVGSACWLTRDLWGPTDKPVVWSIPLVVQGAALEQAAAGTYNDYYRTVAQWIDRYSDGDTIHIRPGWEFNGGWMPWSAIGKPQAYVGAFQELVDTFRSVSDRFVFEWNVNMGNHGMNPADAYPGDGYVDIIGMDFYHDPKWDPADPVAAWNQMVYRTYGLDWLEKFAAAHGKPTAYSEWGVKTDNMAPYVDLAKAWFESHDVAYQIYWDSNLSYSGKLSDGTNPGTGSAFRSAFAEAPQITSAEVSDAPLHVFAGTSATQVWAGTIDADQYTSNGGGDIMVGGFGDDTYVISSSADWVIEWSGGGVDTVVTNLGTYSLSAYVENLTFTGTAASVGTGNDSANIIIGNAGANTLDGGAGNDRISGGDGNDLLRGGPGNDQVKGDAGNDTLYGGDGRDYVDGGSGNDLIDGGTGGDELWALLGDDVIYGGDGDDRMFGNQGNDRLYGGAGNDLADGGSDNDQVKGDAGDDKLYGGDGRDYVDGGDGNDLIDGGAGNDELWALQGNDTIYGGDGDDRMFGNQGNDLLFGGAGNDLLAGGSGNDRLDGGAGTDTAVFDGNAADFRLSASSQAGQWLVTDLRYAYVDTVTGIESFTFNNGTVPFDSLI